MQIPTYLNLRDVPPPAATDEPRRIIVADNGLFVETHSPMFTTSVRVPSYHFDLAAHHEFVSFKCGRIPRNLHRAMLTFFIEAHRLHGGEAALVLLYHPIRRTYRWYCPKQVVDMFETRTGWVAGDTIAYSNPLTLPDGFLTSGDAHLHTGAAIPSKLDIHDDGDGLHIIVGNIATTPSYHIDFVMDGRRFAIEPEAIFEDTRCEPFERPPTAWLRQIQLRSIPYVEQYNYY